MFYIAHSVAEDGLDYIISNCDQFVITTADIFTDDVPDYSKVTSETLVGPETVVGGDWTKSITDDVNTVGTLTKAEFTGATIAANGTGKYLCLLDSGSSVVLGVLQLLEEIDVVLLAGTLDVPEFSVYISENAQDSGAVFFDQLVYGAFLSSIAGSGGMAIGDASMSIFPAGANLYAVYPGGFSGRIFNATSATTAYFTDHDWDCEASWSIASDKASCSGAQTVPERIIQSVPEIVAETVLLLEYTTSSVSAGAVYPVVAGVVGAPTASGDDQYRFITAGHSVEVGFLADVDFTGSVSNARLLLADASFADATLDPGKDWTVRTGGVTFASSKLTFSTAMIAPIRKVYQTVALTAGRYRLRGYGSGLSGSLFLAVSGASVSNLATASKIFRNSLQANYPVSEYTFDSSGGDIKIEAGPTGSAVNGSVNELALWSVTEYLANGQFTTDYSSWTAENSATLGVSAGVLTITNAGATKGGAYQVITTVVGEIYEVVASLKRGTDASVAIKVGTSAGDSSLGTAVQSTTSFEGLSVIFTASGTTTYITIENDGSVSGGTGQCDYITVTEAKNLIDDTWSTSGAYFVSNTLGNTGAASGYAYQAFTTVVGNKYKAICRFNKNTSNARFAAGTSAGATDLAFQDETAGTATLGELTFTATGTTTYISLINLSSTAGQSSRYYDIYVYEVSAAAEGSRTPAGTLLSNGGFEGVKGGWTEINNGVIQISAGEVFIDNTGTDQGGLAHLLVTEAGKLYRISVTARVGTTTSCYVKAGTSAGDDSLGSVEVTSGTDVDVVLTFVAAGASSYVTLQNDATSGGYSAFNTVFCRPVLTVFAAGDFHTTTGWTTGTNWSIDTAAQTAAHTAGSSGSLSYDIGVSTAKTYKLVVTYDSVSGGNITPSLGGVSGAVVSASGVHSDIFEGIADGTLILSAASAAVAVISRIELYEVEQVDGVWTPVGEMLKNGIFRSAAHGRSLVYRTSASVISQQATTDAVSTYSLAGFGYKQDGVTQRPAAAGNGSEQLMRGGSGTNVYSQGLRITAHV